MLLAVPRPRQACFPATRGRPEARAAGGFLPGFPRSPLLRQPGLPRRRTTGYHPPLPHPSMAMPAFIEPPLPRHPMPRHPSHRASWIAVGSCAVMGFTMGCSVRDEQVRPAAATRAWSDAALEASRRGGEPRPEATDIRGIEYVEGHAAGRRRATAEGLPMLLVFRATWCRWSGELAHGPLADRGVVTAARRFVCVTIDADRDADTCRDFGVTGFPTVIVVDATGQERFRATGAAAAGRLALVMRELLGSPDRADRYAGGLDDARL
jgi:hypothetical protein